MINLGASEFFKAIKNLHKDIDDDYEQPSIVIPTLRSYQRKAVKWMIDREKNNDLVCSDGSPFKGGILADEMGLGKTVEMLCCIMANTAPPEFYQRKITFEVCTLKPITPKPSPISYNPSTSRYIPYSKKQAAKNKDNTRLKLKNWYESILNEMSTVSKKRVENDSNEDDCVIECFCIITPPDSTLVFCAMCGKGQHAECVHFEPKPLQEVPFLCSNCWTVNDKLHCKATLIVVPQSILQQWIDEIEKHIARPGLDVFIYNGVHSDGYIQPITFNDYDVVITSYSTLSRDLNYVGNFDIENQNTTRLRHSKKYNYPKSPLPCIKWWRICLDEGQAIEYTNNKGSEMTSCLTSVNKWAMTGTPIQKSLNDLYGILKFLDVSPYSNRKQFLQLMKGEASFIYNWFSNLIWRNSMIDVNSELNLPKITTEEHWLTFSQIEKYFYMSQHDDCSKCFCDAATRKFLSLDIKVKNIDRKKLIYVIGPLYKLRQACVHPQAVNGQFLRIKGTMTMEKLIHVMIDKCLIECNDILRSLVSQHNAIAGLCLIRSEIDNAVDHYKIVLELMEKYKDKKLKIDTCQKIHVMYNLSSVMDEYSMNIDLHESHALKEEMERLEKEYLDASKHNIDETHKTITLYSIKLTKLLGDKKLGYSEWWSDMLDWIFSPKDFLIKVQADLEDYRVPGVTNIANRMKSVNDVFNILGIWLADLDTAREDTISILKTLEETPMNNLVQAALLCHLRLKSKKNLGKNKCPLCQAEHQLQTYESLLFSVSNKPKNVSTDLVEEKDEEITYESTSKGLWKMSQKEFLLMKLFQYGQAKIINKNCLNDAAEHMKVLDLIRKEFRYLRLLWTHLSDSLSAHDEIVMAKSRLRLGDNIVPEEEGPPKKKKKRNSVNEENDVVMEHYVDYNMMSLRTEIPVTNTELEKKIGTLLYLENLKKQKENSTEIEPCPICCLNSETLTWAVLQCGHSICSKCLASMCSHSEDFGIVCPMCRNGTSMDSISYVKNSQESEETGVVIKGSFSTKIQSITLKLMQLIAEDPTVKVLIFSKWDKALSLLGDALEQNSINYRLLKRYKYKKTLKDFKANNKINALLMQLSLGAKGLNLTEATRIFFVEPLIDKADQLQAIGRIHRIGQTKPTFVHNFIIKNSIEENITKMFTNNKYVDNMNDVTLAQLIDVFSRDD